MKANISDALFAINYPIMRKQEFAFSLIVPQIKKTAFSAQQNKQQ